jgi:radical SAM protein with 4Fe4S-binding SPASM domain
MSKLLKAISLWKNDKSKLLLYKISKKFGFRDILPPLPFILMIEPTNSCNLRCPTCPTGSGKSKRPNSMMSFSEFKKIINQVGGNVKHIILWNFGEPFLNRELLDMIKYATSAGIHVTTSTNGEFFKSKEFCQEIVKSGLNYLIICLDGANQETISRFRRGSKFNDIENGFRLIHAAKKIMASKTPTIELQFILMKHNEHQRNYMKQHAKELGADFYSEKTVGIDYNDSEFQNLAKELLPNDLSLSRYYLKKDGKFSLKGEILNDCSWVYEGSVINSNGTVVPCSYDPYSKYVMGNVFEENLEKIWKNDKYQSFRRQIKRDRKSISICNACSEGRYSIKQYSNTEINTEQRLQI